MSTPWSAWRPPLHLQVLALAFASLLLPLILAIAILLNAPQPRPTPILLREVAAALSGGSLDTAAHRRLVRIESHGAGPGRTPPYMMGRRAELAGLLGVAPEQVALDEQPQPALERILTHGFNIYGPPPQPRRNDPGRPPEGPPPSPGQPGGPGPAPFRGFGEGPGPGWPPPGLRFQDRHPEDDLLFGDFTASLRRPDGSLVTVRPGPEPFPTPWQLGMIAWLGGSVLLLAPAALWFASRISAPLNDFARAAERMGRDPLAPPLTLSGPAEIRRAAQAFNEMQQRVRRYVEDRTGMVGAISHDLRTPLARIRFKLEAERIDRRSVAGDVDQMETMVGQVLAFLRDASEPQGREAINILSLVETAVDDAAEVGAPVRLVHSDDGLVEGDVHALQRLVGNLIDNAVKYGARADVSVIRRPGEMIVEVEDDGPGLAPAERVAVFKPFYRTEAARTLDAGGVGLGLALSRSIARAHGGEVALEVRRRGLVAVLSLPTTKF